MRKHPQIVIGVLLIALFICIAITAPLLAPNDPNATNLALKNAPPSAEYPLGCDQMGRCELSRLIYGARYSLSLTVPVLIVLAAIALFIGCYTSYKGGLIDEVIRLLCDIFMAFPLLVIAMSLVSVINNSVASIITAIGISMSAWFLRKDRVWKGVCRIRKSIWCICNADRTSPHYPECIATVCCLFYHGNSISNSIGIKFCIFGCGPYCWYSGVGSHA